MRLDILPIGQFDENIYIVHHQDHVFIVDPGRHAKEIQKYIRENEVVDGIVLTHGHDDHTGAVDDLVDQYHCKVLIHQDDLFMVKEKGDAFTGGSTHPIQTEVETVNEGDYTLGIFPLHFIHTPGHTDGSMLVKFQDCLFTGDTLFKGTVGRTDLYAGDSAKMSESMRIISTLGPELKVYPGHGPSSTIANEKIQNPFLNGLYQL